MKLKQKTILMSLKGEPLKNEKGVSITLQDVVVESLLWVHQGDDGKVKYEKYKLAQKFMSNENTVSVTSEEIVTIKESVGKVYGPAVIGPCFDILENNVETLKEVSADPIQKDA